jgi:hypothetical protein
VELMADEKSLIRRIVAVFDRPAARKMESEFEGSLQSAGAKGGEKAGRGFLKELRSEFDKKKAELSEQFARGIIDEKEFKKQSNAAARAFNEGLLKSMDAARKRGEMTDKEYVKLSRTLKKVGDDGDASASRLHRGFGKVVAVLGGLFIANRIARFGADAIQTAIEADAVWNRLAGTLENAGVQFADVREEITANARAMQDATAVGDEDYADVLSELVSMSNDYAGSLQNVGLVADIAAAKKIDLTTAAQLVGKAMVGETSTLKRYGIVVEEGADAIEVMRERFKGMAENEMNTLSGQLKRMNNEWGDFKEAVGRAMTEAGGGTSIVDSMSNALRTMSIWVEQNADALKQWVTNALDAAATVAQMLGITSPARAGAAREISSIAAQGGGTDFLLRRQNRLDEEKRRLEASLVDFNTGKGDQSRPFHARKREAEEYKTRLEEIALIQAWISGRLTSPPASLTRQGVSATPAPAGTGPATAPARPAGPYAHASGTVGGTEYGMDVPGGVPLYNVGENEDRAEEFVTPWERALHRINEAAEDNAGIFSELGRAWAEGGIAGLAKLFKVKARQALAEAAGMAARAVAFLALNNIPGAAKAGKAAAMFAAEAAAWGGASAVAGAAGGGGGGGSVGGVSAPNTRAAGNVQQLPPEWHIHMDPFSPTPHVVRVVAASAGQAARYYGKDPTVHIHPGTGFAP